MWFTVWCGGDQSSFGLPLHCKRCPAQLRAAPFVAGRTPGSFVGSLPQATGNQIRGSQDGLSSHDFLAFKLSPFTLMYTSVTVFEGVFSHSVGVCLCDIVLSRLVCCATIFCHILAIYGFIYSHLILLLDDDRKMWLLCVIVDFSYWMEAGGSFQQPRWRCSWHSGAVFHKLSCTVIIGRIKNTDTEVWQ